MKNKNGQKSLKVTLMKPTSKGLGIVSRKETDSFEHALEVLKNVHADHAKTGKMREVIIYFRGIK